VTKERARPSLFPAAASLALVLAPAASVAVSGPAFAGPTWAGWGLAALNAGLKDLINRRALQCSQDRFLIWSCGANGVRAAGLLAGTLGAYAASPDGFPAFFASLMASYLVFMAADVLQLHRDARMQEQAP
jgi:hypothetical protein